MIRLGAVDYLNARPLVHGLDGRPDLFTLRFDPPAQCALLLHEHTIDAGMIPTIEYCRGPEYRVVRGIGIVSEGRVASVALFASKALAEITTIATDTSSRTSNALLRILCAESFGIEPAFSPMPPDAARMLNACDAALIIGDPALYFDPAAAGVEKIDLGEQWTRLTGLPFVWAFWAGHPGAVSPETARALAEARDRGVAAAAEIAAHYCGAERAALGQAYLRDNIQYYVRDREEAGLRTFYELAARHGLIGEPREPMFYD